MITVLGASGFVGSHVVEHLRRERIEHQAPARGETLAGRALGHVIYCIGVTDFRERPWDAVDAHVCTLLDVVRYCTYESILYLSSIRVYAGVHGVAREQDALTLNPLDFSELYGISKVAGESIVLAPGAKGKVARLANVYGARMTNSFLAMILDEAASGAIALRSSPDSVRDYVSASDAAALLVRIALEGRERIYNVASGVDLRNGDVCGAIARLSGCRVTVAPDAVSVPAPRIDTTRIRDEFGFTPASLTDELPALLATYA